MSDFGYGRTRVLGNIANDPELRETKGGTPVVSIRVAAPHRRPNGNGEWVTETEFYPFEIYGSAAKYIAGYGGKGSTIELEGEMRTYKYEDREGNQRYGFKFETGMSDFVQLFDSGRKSDPEDALDDGPPREKDKSFSGPWD